MRAKYIYFVISIGIAGGCTTGIIFSVKEILANRYISYAMYKLCADCLQKLLNKWTVRGIAVSLLLIIMYLFYYYTLTLLIKKEEPLYSNFIKTLNTLLPFRYTTALVIPCLIVLGVSNLLPGMLTKNLHCPPIILISIDDLRADHLGCYGYQRNTSPTIDSFAKEGILFKNCFIPEPWTLSSHLSMLTSLYPITHGTDMTHSMHPAIVTLAEVLSNEGYCAMGFVSGGAWTQIHYGFGQGFDHYSAGGPERNGEQQNTLIRKYLEKYQEKDLFLFLHYFDVHSDYNKLPYDAPPPYTNLFSTNYDGGFKGGDGDIFASKYLGYINKKQITLKEDDLHHIISLYDNGIAYVDKCMDDLFTMLKDMDLFENALIIITADHGEEFQEHGFLSHGSNPYYYEESVHVPLIIKLPNAENSVRGGNKGKVISSLAESIDIMPTIVDLLHIKGPRMQGQSLLGLIDGTEKGKEYVFGLTLSGRHFIRTERWKMLNDSGLKEGRFKLFNLENDPMERVNLIGKGLEVEDRLKRKLKEEIEVSLQLRKELLNKKYIVSDAKRDHKDVFLTQEEQEKLKALGYLQ